MYDLDTRPFSLHLTDKTLMGEPHRVEYFWVEVTY